MPATLPAASASLPGATGGWTRQQRRAGIIMAVPALLVLLAVVIYPIARSILLSFQHAELAAGGLTTTFAGLDNYTRLLSDETFAIAVRQSAFFTVAEVLLITALALGMALLLHHPLGRSPFFRTILLIPWAIAPVANAVLWKWMYHANYGILNASLEGLGVIARPVNWLGDPVLALRMLLLADIWKSVPFIALLLLAGLQNIPAFLYKAARTVGNSFASSPCRGCARP